MHEPHTGIKGRREPGDRPGRPRARLLAAALLLGTLAACKGTFPVMDHDRYAGLTRDDYRAAFEPRPAPPAKAAPGAPIPPLQPLVELPPPPSPAERKLVSISVDETVPLKDVLIELARKAQVDLELDPRISGGVILTMRNRPLREVIERIADLAGLRYEFQGQTLRIERDEPYHVNYRVDYLLLTRQANSQVETSVNVMGGGEQATSGNASSSAISGQSDTNFWQELDAGLSQILGNSTPPGLAVVPAAAPAAPPGGDPGSIAPGAGQPNPGAPGPGNGGQAPPPAPTAADPSVAAPPAPPAVLTTAATVPGGQAGQNNNGPEPSFSINRQAGVISVFATRRQHKLIEAYLAELRASISRQVLIEAKILEVALNDEFSSGINWRAMIGDFSSAARLGTTVVSPPFRTALDATPNVVTLAFDNSDLDVIAHFIQRFGTVRTLSSPRLTVQQNQTAILKVAQNQVFFRLFFQTIDQDNGNTQTNVNSVIQTVPVGVIMTVQPSINQETDEISLALRPTVTRVVDEVDDPAVAIASNNTVKSQVPVVAVQEIDSVVKLHSGQVAVMGGLMSDSSSNQEEGVPVLGQLPVIGYLFKARDDATRKTELVIFLRATILENGGIDPVDADFYKRFGRDRHPFPMPETQP